MTNSTPDEEPHTSILERRLPSTPENREYLRRRLEHLIAEVSYFTGYPDFIQRLKEFYDVHSDEELRSFGYTEDLPVQLDRIKLAQFMTGTDSAINKRDFGLIVRMLYDIGELSAENAGEFIEQSYPDALYHALLNFMGVGSQTVANIKRNAPGLYRAWRPSSTYPGMFWRGLLHVWIDYESRALKVMETYASKGAEGRYSRNITFDGYLFKKSSQYVILARNRDLNALECIMIPEVTVFENQIYHMAGFVTDQTPSRLYSSRIHFDLLVRDEVTPKQLEDHQADLAMVHEDSDEMPASIKHFFSERVPPRINLF